MDPPVSLSEGEATVWRFLQANAGRVVARNELARHAGVRGLSPRRVDVLLVAVRRAIGAEQLRNVRGRGWLLLKQSLLDEPLFVEPLTETLHEPLKDSAASER